MNGAVARKCICVCVHCTQKGKGNQVIDVIRPDDEVQKVTIPLTAYRNLIERSLEQLLRINILMGLYKQNQFVSDVDTMTILGFTPDLIGAIARNNTQLLKAAKERMAREGAVEEDLPYGTEN